MAGVEIGELDFPPTLSEFRLALHLFNSTPIAGLLKDQLLSVRRKIRLGILTPERQLLDVREMLFAGNGERILLSADIRKCGYNDRQK